MHSLILKLYAISKFLVHAMFVPIGGVWNECMTSNFYIITNLSELIIYGRLMVRVQCPDLVMNMEAQVQLHWIII